MRSRQQFFEPVFDIPPIAVVDKTVGQGPEEPAMAFQFAQDQATPVAGKVTTPEIDLHFTRAEVLKETRLFVTVCHRSGVLLVSLTCCTPRTYTGKAPLCYLIRELFRLANRREWAARRARRRRLSITPLGVLDKEPENNIPLSKMTVAFWGG